MILSAERRREIKEAIDRATRAGLRPARRDARPGHPSRFANIGVKTVTNTGREIVLPTLTDYDNANFRKARILRGLNG